ncbi:hypothetical protein [Aureimonas sp. N4]|uniref:hypothetical protein n=1 Tax=Aureimonas sp. N4 TaxID=1638165 RepID=UPI000780C427|nr:hypothetical protein [Aureimonas sp. N4]
MRLAAVLPLVALLALSSTAAVAGPDIDHATKVGAARGVERFGDIYREGGISAAADAVRACYRSPEAKRGAEGLAECAALDVAASVADLQARMTLRVPPYPFFAGAAMESRVSAGLKAAKLPRSARASLDRAILAAMEGPEAGSADDDYMDEEPPRPGARAEDVTDSFVTSLGGRTNPLPREGRRLRRRRTDTSALR